MISRSRVLISYKYFWQSVFFTFQNFATQPRYLTFFCTGLVDKLLTLGYSVIFSYFIATNCTMELYHFNFSGHNSILPKIILKLSGSRDLCHVSHRKYKKIKMAWELLFWPIETRENHKSVSPSFCGFVYPKINSESEANL